FVGWIPESRSTTWPEALQRLMVHPIIGWGPYYTAVRGWGEGSWYWYWPHDLYLYVANLVGVVGLAIFLWFLGTLWVISRPKGDRLDDPDYARGFLLVAHVQLFMFLVDEIKIEYLRNPVYISQIWVLFSSIVAAYQISKGESVPEPKTA